MDKKNIKVRFAAINPRTETFIEDAIERTDGRKSYVTWGSRNTFPDYLCTLRKSSATLGSIINGSVDYVAGDEVRSNIGKDKLNKKGETATDIVRQIAKNYFTYGGFALQVIRANDGTIAEVYVLDLRYVRSDKDNELFFYSEEWQNARAKNEKYPRFVPEFTEIPTAIHYVKNDDTQVYPEPLYVGAIVSAEIERNIDQFHLNTINNGFMGSYVVNFNNGVPEDEVKDEIEKMVNAKFAGAGNAGRIMITFNDTQDTAVTVNKLEMDDYGDKYDTMEQNVKQKLFTSFRANPNLFGIPTAQGFNSEEYESAFKLYNRTQIQPVQDKIIDALDYIYGMKGSITIVPFSLDRATSNIE